MTPARPALQAADLWSLQRLGPPSLSPDGRWAVCSVTRFDLDANQGRSALWLFTTAAGGPPPRQLTHCGEKDGQPAFSPQGDRIAFIARRRGADGRLDAAPQLYTLDMAGGEAVRRSDFAPGVESFKWLPDGRGLVFAAWVWPGLKGAAAQSAAWQAEAQRKETGYVTSQAYYRHWDRNLPAGRVLHLLLLDLASGRISDLFEGTALELPRDSGDNTVYDIHPGSRQLAFQHDPAAVQRLGQRTVISEIGFRRTGRQGVPQTLAAHADWTLAAPRYSPDGQRLALLAAHTAQHHMAPQQLAVLGHGQAFTPAALCLPGWDLEADAPLAWQPDGQALLFAAEQRGRRPLWRWAPGDATPAVLVPGGWVQGFDAAAGCIAYSADSQQHPARLAVIDAAAAGQPVASRRLDHFNDAELARVTLGKVRELQVTGAQGDALQLWLTFPPGFNPRKKHALMHVIHGGPFAAAGDTFSYRWNPQVLASCGQVVAQLNYHGSSGFGFEFKRSLVGRQGELELQDIEAATDWLLQQPWCDARRVFATGGSYGGFLVAWMNGQVPAGRYRAYVCHAGVFDRVATFSADSYPVRPKDLAANWWQDLPRVLAQSPHAFAARMRTPTLVIHGALDFRVPDCNGLAYYNTLQALGVPARLLWFADENHWVLKPQNSLQWYREFLGWISAHDLPAAGSRRTPGPKPPKPPETPA